ncbi:MAG: MFS transporter [Armatimonadetes bacterium]|nr:MFS transporter [Armatimonadota bacterium]
MPSPTINHEKAIARDWALLSGLTFCFACGFAVYNGIFANFIREDLGVGPSQLGWLESLREVPGLLTAFTAGTLVVLAETRLSFLAIAVCALGVGITGYAWNFHSLVAIVVLWSVGGHIWFSLSPAIIMTLGQGQDSGRHLGRMGSVGALGTLLTLGLTVGFSQWYKTAHPGGHMPYRTLFLIAGGMMFVGALLALRISHRACTQGERERLVWRGEYRLYYLLTFLEGCRRQIFTTFAPFVLIVVFHTPVQTMLMLAFVNAAVSMVCAPLVGRWIDRCGERYALTLYNLCLIAVFCGYAWFLDVRILYGLFVLDNLLFSFGLGITLYLNRIVRPGDLTPSLAMGTTMNHVAAVLVPVTGGILWKTMDNYRIPFWIGIAVVIWSLLAVRRLPGGEITGPVGER